MCLLLLSLRRPVFMANDASQVLKAFEEDQDGKTIGTYKYLVYDEEGKTILAEYETLHAAESACGSAPLYFPQNESASEQLFAYVVRVPLVPKAKKGGKAVKAAIPQETEHSVAWKMASMLEIARLRAKLEEAINKNDAKAFFCKSAMRGSLVEQWERRITELTKA